MEREIGRGGSSRVYEVRDQATGALFALKVAPPTGAGRRGDPLSREVEVLRGIRHRHLVQVQGTADTSWGEGVLMEYMPGGSAADLVAARGPVRLGEAVTVIAPVAQALAALHGAGAVHGDVSPGNILFTGEGMPKLGDLGLASLVGQPGVPGGTPGFAAPEEAGSSMTKSLHPARDVFSLGAVAWFLLTGRAPAPTSHRPPLGSLVPAVPDEFSLLIEECLQEDADLRPAAGDLARRVFCAADPEPVSLTESVHPAAMGHMVTQLGGAPPEKYRGWNPWLRLRRPRVGQRPVGAQGRREPGAPAQRARRSRRGQLPGRAGGRVPLPAVVAAALVLVAAAAAAAWWFAHPDSTDGRGAEPRVAAAPVPPAGAAPEATPSATPAEGGTPRPPAAPEPSAPSRAPTDSQAVPSLATDAGRAARALAGLRDDALTAADADALRRIHHPGGTSLAADTETVRALRSGGIRYDGLRTRLSDVVVLPGATPAAARVEAISTMEPYRVVDGAGRIVEAAAEPRVERVVLELRRSDGSWRIFRVAEDTDGA